VCIYYVLIDTIYGNLERVKYENEIEIRLSIINDLYFLKYQFNLNEILIVWTGQKAVLFSYDITLDIL